MTVAPITTTHGPVQSVPVNDPGSQLQEVRKRLQELTPPGRWNAVVAEVSRVQAQNSSSVLEAYHLVLARLATGWVPPPVAFPPPGR